MFAAGWPVSASDRPGRVNVSGRGQLRSAAFTALSWSGWRAR